MARSRSRSRSSGSSRGNIITVNMKGVEGKRPRIAPGEYASKVLEVTQEDGDKAPYLAWQFEVTEGKAEGAKLFYNTSLSKPSLWNLRGLLEAMDVEVPDDEMDIDLTEMVDKEVLLIVDDEEYEGKMKSKVVDFGPLDDSGGKKDKEETSSRRSRKDKDKEKDADSGSGGRSSRRNRKEKEKKKLTQDEVNDMSQDELEEVDKEHNLELDFGELKTLRKMKAAVIDALDEDGLLAD
jgi:hypothetical protein